jgi:hypothetical protein
MVNMHANHGIISVTMDGEYVAWVFRLGQAEVNAHRVMKNSLTDKDTPDIIKINTRLYISARKDLIDALQPHLFLSVTGFEYDAVEEEFSW